MDFRSVINDHAARYPLMEPQDFVKLAYQNQFGPEHMLQDLPSVERYIRQEWTETPSSHSPAPEPIGNGLCRFHLSSEYDASLSSALLGKLFVLTAQNHPITMDGWAEKLEYLSELQVTEIKPWLETYRRQGCPAVHHSQSFRQAYQPHYRILRTEYAVYFPALLAVWRLVQAGRSAVVLIDGRCGSGKTSLAALMESLFPCRVVHMDDFYLPLSLRAPNWTQLPGGNIDFKRFSEEIVSAAQTSDVLSYRPFDCQTGRLLEKINLPPYPITIVEGSYSQHPSSGISDSLKIFLTCTQETQTARLMAREGDYYPAFPSRWIPLEESYFQKFQIEQNCDIVIDTSDCG